ncbi:MAG: CarD family transcriptional regulator [Clostridia bacterium]|nr:CarD family transcriptional regulator [Clostridia bacterium]
MFKIGDTVLYGSDGVCKISEVTKKVFGGTEIDYYVLTPVFDNRSTIFVPIKNKKLTDKMKSILNAEDIYKIICEVEDEPQWIKSDPERSEVFKNIVSGGDLKAVIRLIKSVCIHRDEVLKNGKKLHKSDEAAFKDAVRILYEELSLTLKISKEDIGDIVCRKVPFDTLINKTV